MTIRVTTRALTVGSALALAASGLMGGGVADAGNGTLCAPTTRVIDAPADSFAAALGPSGHVVTRLYVSQSRYLETLHAPDGTMTDIVDGDLAPWGAADVNGRGVVAGTQWYQAETGITLYQPWMFRRGQVRLLANPGKLGHNVRKDYYAVAVNPRSAVVGVKTNANRFAPSDPEYVARPVLWPTPGSTPIKLDMPRGFSLPYLSPRLVDVLIDGTITAVLIDGDGRYHLALWVTPGADPDLHPLPDTWVPTALAGQWVMGRIGSAPGRVFVQSWTEAFVIDSPRSLHPSRISSNGTFTVNWYEETQTPTSYVGSPTRPVAQLGNGVRTNDVAGTVGGQVLVERDEASIEVISCALSLPEATDITVTPVAPNEGVAMKRSAIAVLTAAVSAVSLAVVPVSQAAAAGQGTACTPTTRTIDTLTYATPIALSPRGHVVAEEGDPGAIPALWLHRPDGTKSAIAFAGGGSPWSASDVSGRGVSVGAQVRFPTQDLFYGWIGSDGAAAWLPRPSSNRSYLAQSVNGRGAVAGVVTNLPFSSPGRTDFEAAPVVWPSADSDPRELAMPDGHLQVAFDGDKPLISIRRDGMVSAVLDDYNSRASYLARWRPGATDPILDVCRRTQILSPWPADGWSGVRSTVEPRTSATCRCGRPPA